MPSPKFTVIAIDQLYSFIDIETFETVEEARKFINDFHYHGGPKRETMLLEGVYEINNKHE